MWPGAPSSASGFRELKTVSPKTVTVDGKKDSSSGGIVPVFTVLVFLENGLLVSECDIGVPTTTWLKTAASCCFIAVFVAETVMYPQAFRSLTDRGQHTWQWSRKVVTAENFLSPSDA